jgi:hypothetical protein
MGELFCRYNISKDDDIVLCISQKPFSSTGNLRTHAISHGASLPAQRKGTATRKEISDAAGKVLQSILNLF